MTIKVVLNPLPYNTWENLKFDLLSPHNRGWKTNHYHFIYGSRHFLKLSGLFKQLRSLLNSHTTNIKLPFFFDSVPSFIKLFSYNRSLASSPAHLDFLVLDFTRRSTSSSCSAWTLPTFRVSTRASLTTTLGLQTAPSLTGSTSFAPGQLKKTSRFVLYGLR